MLGKYCSCKSKEKSFWYNKFVKTFEFKRLRKCEVYYIDTYHQVYLFSIFKAFKISFT